MILVEMVLHSAITGKVTGLASLTISNTGTGTATRSDYAYTVKGKRGQVIKRGLITKWPRQAKTPIALLQRVINDAYPKGTAA